MTEKSSQISTSKPLVFQFSELSFNLIRSLLLLPKRGDFTRQSHAFSGTKKSQNAWYDGVWGQNVVEARGVEPLSEIASKRTSPGAACDWLFPFRLDHRQSCRSSSLMIRDERQDIRPPGASFNLHRGKVCAVNVRERPADQSVGRQRLRRCECRFIGNYKLSRFLKRPTRILYPLS